jgi:hypothetical protein
MADAEVRELVEVDDLREALELFERIWGSERMFAVEVLRALATHGSAVLAEWPILSDTPHLHPLRLPWLFILTAGWLAPFYYVASFVFSAIVPFIPTPLIGALGGTAFGFVVVGDQRVVRHKPQPEVRVAVRNVAWRLPELSEDGKVEQPRLEPPPSQPVGIITGRVQDHAPACSCTNLQSSLWVRPPVESLNLDCRAGR